MSLFNFRRTGSAASSNATSGIQTESLDVVRKRAKHRLIGSALLVLIGIVVFPLLFDTQPRPIAIDIPIEIPGKNIAKPLTPSVAQADSATPPAAEISSTAPAATAPVPASSAAPATEKLTPSASLSPKEEILAEPAPASPAVVKAPIAEAKPNLKAEAKPLDPQPAALSKEGARAMALLEGRAPPPAVASPAGSVASDSRFIVQVGAFADAAKVREIRAKLDKAGLKTYTQLIETSEGSRTRVRVGPFTNRADAEKAVGKIKTLDLPAAILTL